MKTETTITKQSGKPYRLGVDFVACATAKTVWNVTLTTRQGSAFDFEVTQDVNGDNAVALCERAIESEGLKATSRRFQRA